MVQHINILGFSDKDGVAGNDYLSMFTLIVIGKGERDYPYFNVAFASELHWRWQPDFSFLFVFSGGYSETSTVWVCSEIADVFIVAPTF